MLSIKCGSHRKAQKHRIADLGLGSGGIKGREEKKKIGSYRRPKCTFLSGFQMCLQFICQCPLKDGDPRSTSYFIRCLLSQSDPAPFPSPCLQGQPRHRATSAFVSLHVPVSKSMVKAPCSTKPSTTCVPDAGEHCISSLPGT